ncbi:MAG: hypothetical protein LUG93_10210 [Lachnospiraceae bacterium]|nr:hypothetical protein [Lachnospiraceae bacterium]
MGKIPAVLGAAVEGDARPVPRLNCDAVCNTYNLIKWSGSYWCTEDHFPSINASVTVMIPAFDCAITQTIHSTIHIIVSILMVQFLEKRLLKS